VPSVRGDRTVARKAALVRRRTDSRSLGTLFFKTPRASKALFPLFLKLAGRRVLVVGGGRVAAVKIAGLLEAGAAVTVVAPKICPEIRHLPVTTRPREFVAQDLDKAWLVIAAATGLVNRRVAALAHKRRVFVNAVDDPRRASAFAGGVLRRGGVTLAVSTDGQAPALAGLLRQGLEQVVPAELAVWLSRARALRRRWKRQGVPIPARRPLLLEALNRLYDKDPGLRNGGKR